MSLYAYLTVLFIIIGIYVFYKRRSIREGLDTCTGKADGCYQYQAIDNPPPIYIIPVQEFSISYIDFLTP